MITSVSERAKAFHRQHPVADMLGLNLSHPRFLVDNIDLGQRQEDCCRGDFHKFGDWGLSVVMCKGGPAFYGGDFAWLWQQQPEHRQGRDEPLYLSGITHNSTQLLLSVLDRFLCQVEANPHLVRLVQRVSDLDVARREGRVAVLMGANHSDWFGDAPGVLRMVARAGLRMVTLATGSRELGWDAYNETRSGGRMTDLGVQMIGEMNRLGILVDISHLNDPCSLDVIAISNRPVVASHSNPRGLDGSPRSAPDEVMRALADRGGLLGITPPISRPPGEQPLRQVPEQEMEATLALIRYALDRMGVDGVGIGTHFNSTVLPWVTDGLLRAGFSEEDTAKLMGGNYQRVLRQVLPA